MKTEKLIKEAHENAVNRGEYVCPDCGGSGKVPGEYRRDNLALTRPSSIDCSTCNGTGIDPDKNIGEMLMMIVADLSGALEAHQCGRLAKWKNYNRYVNKNIRDGKDYHHMYCVAFNNNIKNTFEDKIADAFIRLFELCEYLGKNIKFNDDEFYRRGWSNVDADFLMITAQIIQRDLSFAVNLLYGFCKHHNIDIEKHIEAKMEYNNNRR